VNLLALPLTSTLIGALLGGLAIRLGWTGSPELVIIVPALMVMPGTHLLNALFDLMDNQVPMSLARLGLALGVILASALGIVIGIELTLPEPTFSGYKAAGGPPNLFVDMLLAGIATGGFAVLFNTPLRHLSLTVVGGMVGHGLHYLALEAGCRLEAATLLGGALVGAIAAWKPWSGRAPVAAIAFAGAVTMIPGATLYRALGGALQIARGSGDGEQALVAETLGQLCHGLLVVAGLGLGLVAGVWFVHALIGDRANSPQRKTS
jgi:uncharacterized membrane protein YjjB (DUF3815 family)